MTDIQGEGAQAATGIVISGNQSGEPGGCDRRRGSSCGLGERRPGLGARRMLHSGDIRVRGVPPCPARVGERARPASPAASQLGSSIIRAPRRHRAPVSSRGASSCGPVSR